VKVPVIITQFGDTQLSIYNNKKLSIIDRPFKPYILLQKDAFADFVHGPSETWTKVPQLEQREYVRCAFNTNKELLDFKNANSNRSRYMFNNPYLEQLYISSPELVLRYPNTSDLKVMFFDIEVASKGDGLFPRAGTNEILCIGYSIWTYSTDNKKRKDKMNIIKGYSDTDKDRKILESFLDVIDKEDPDIIAQFNGDDFDWPYIIERAGIMKVDIARIGRNNKGIYFDSLREENKIKISGRISFDIYLSNAGVKKDQQLFGIKSRNLKEVSRFYKCRADDYELKDEIENLYKLFKTDPEKLYKYQEADILRTEHVGNVYLRNCITLSEMITVPLNSIISMYSSFIPKLLMGRNMEKKKLINTETNFQKYNSSTGSIAKLRSEGKKQHQGAIVGIYKYGFFEKTYKIDFAGMYPSSIQTWNLGPDTTFLAEVKPYTGQYSFTEDNKHKWYRVPDDVIQADVVIKVLKEEGFLRREIARLKQERVKIKEEMKTAPEELKETLQSQQWAIKVLNNSLYGSFSLRSSTYGDMISGLMVAGICRWATTQVMDRIKNNLITTDTDGMITDIPISENETNEWLNNLILETFKISDNYMKVESEEFGRSFFYAMKTYIVEKEGKPIRHGSSIFSSRASKVVDRAIDISIQHIFNSKPVEEVLHEALDFKGLSVADFEERLSLRKEQREYDNQSDMKILLAKQVEMKTGRIVTQGDQISFVVTKNRLPFKELDEIFKNTSSKWNYTFSGYVTNTDEIDLKYYKERIEKALAKFGIEKIQQMQLDLGI